MGKAVAYCSGFGLDWWAWGLMGIGVLTIISAAIFVLMLYLEPVHFRWLIRRAEEGGDA